MNYKQILNVLSLVLLIALVVPFVIYGAPGVIGAEYSFVVLTGSMAPAIDPGDVVVVADRDPATIERGDVITFVRGTEETPVTHRVVGVDETDAGVSFETKGDANSDVDASPVPAANVLGVVIMTIPFLGYAVQAVSAPIGFVLLVVIPLGLLVVTELWSILKAMQSDETEATDDNGTADETEPPVATEGTHGEITVSITELRLSAGVLALGTPYTIYVALTLQTALSISVAFATTLSVLAISGMLLSTRASGPTADRSPMEPTAAPTAVADDAVPTTDGGSDPTAVETAAEDEGDVEPAFEWPDPPATETTETEPTANHPADPTADGTEARD